MFKGKKFTVTMMLLLSCTVSMIAQANYYYKGKKIPLTVDVDKVCVSIPKSNEVISRDVLNSINVIDNIKDDDFDIFILKKSDLKQLNISNYRDEVGKSILLSPCYKTMAGTDVFLTPYVNIRLKNEQDIKQR